MKRRMFMVALCLLATGWHGGLPLHAETQDGHEGASRWSVTPHVGANLWFARYDIYHSPGETLTMDKRPGLTAGVELGFEVVPRVCLSLGVDYALQRFATLEPLSGSMARGGDPDIIAVINAETDYSRSTVAAGRLWFPLQVGVRVWNGLSLRSGIQPGLTLHGNTAKWEYRYISPLSSSLPEEGTVEYDFERVHWYVPVGITYEYRRWVADLRYYFSLKGNAWTERREQSTAFVMSQSRISVWRDNARDNMLQLTIGYRFSL